uniref:Uncharacterized protein n=1 Tax=Candidatus Kentrum sp. DK TaxID=2126562 RepID=A0A450TRG2_9GAMM|nr:MAG: hypothetical protein BECKDK2373B_GA0170837_12961 [Candidatus Kentron sp. DK]
MPAMTFMATFNSNKFCLRPVNPGRFSRVYSFGKARHDQSDAIFLLYRGAAVEGKKNSGTSDWSEKYPTREILDEDIELRRVFILEEGDTIRHSAHDYLELEYNFSYCGPSNLSKERWFSFRFRTRGWILSTIRT